MLCENSNYNLKNTNSYHLANATPVKVFEFIKILWLLSVPIFQVNEVVVILFDKTLTYFIWLTTLWKKRDEMRNGMRKIEQMWIEECEICEECWQSRLDP